MDYLETRINDGYKYKKMYNECIQDLVDLTNVKLSLARYIEDVTTKK